MALFGWAGDPEILGVVTLTPMSLGFPGNDEAFHEFMDHAEIRQSRHERDERTAIDDQRRLHGRKSAPG